MSQCYTHTLSTAGTPVQVCEELLVRLKQVCVHTHVPESITLLLEAPAHAQFGLTWARVHTWIQVLIHVLIQVQT